ncbi:MAG: hypothetical protein M3176_16820, partial [Chloroflexota bacterium]|nr:hypothetical protein [Chloroflexota bacterium]
YADGEAPDLLHILTAAHVRSQGGIDFNGDAATSSTAATAGGRLELDVNSITFGPSGSDIIGASTFDGGANTAGGGADGGTLTVNATGDIAVASVISATTGINATGVSSSGAGGLVTLNTSAGAISVSSTIQVSSNQAPSGPPSPLRVSASGGDITLHSGRSSGQAITLTSDSHLLSLLNATAPGPGGLIDITSNGGDITADGEIRADRGTIHISNGGDVPHAPSQTYANGNALITLDGGSLTAETIQIASLGDLSIGATSPVTFNFSSLDLSADGNIDGGQMVFSTDFFGGATSPVINITAGGNLTARNLDASITNDFDIAEGANINLQTGGNLIANGTGEGDGLSLSINNAGAHLGADENISLTVGGNLEANFVNLLVNNRDGGVDGDAILNMNVGSLSIGGPLQVSIQNDQGSGMTGGTIGRDALVTFGSTSDVNVAGEARFEIVNSGGSIGRNSSILVNAGGNLTADSLVVLIDNSAGGTFGAVPSLNMTIAGRLTTAGDANFNFFFDNGSNPSPIFSISAGSINIGGRLNGGTGSTDGGRYLFFDNPPSILGSQDIILTGGADFFGRLSAGRDLSSSGQTFVYSIDAGRDILVSGPGNIGAFNLTAGRDINISSTGMSSGDVGADSTVAAGTLTLTNISQIHPDSVTASPAGGTKFSDFSLDVASIVSTGPALPKLSANGFDATDTLSPGNGANITLNLRVGGLTIGSTGMLIGISTNGGQFGSDTLDGNGGTVDITAAGDVSLTDGNIIATTGLVPDSGSVPKGTGGAVNITTDGAINVASTIQVSSADPAPSPTAAPSPPRRRSKTGGKISLTSNKAGGQAGRQVAINISNTGQLLSLLDAASAGPGGQVVIKATGANST